MKPVRTWLFLIAGGALFGVSAPTGTSQVVPQEGAINTTRSNIKNTSREGGTPIKKVWVKLAPSSPRSPGRVTTTDDQGKFSFANVMPGEYVLTFSATELKAVPDKLGQLQGDLGSFRTFLGTKIDTVDASLNARIVVTGASEPIERGWAVTVKQAAAATARTTNRLDPIMLDTSGDAARAGKANYGNIVLRVVGTKRLGGHVTLIK